MDFAPHVIGVQDRPASPLPRAVLYSLLALFAMTLIWACVGRLDMVAVAQGRLVPQSFLKIVQPAESGVVREILVGEGEEVRAGQVLVRMDARLSDADGRTLFAELHRKRLQLRRIESELAGVPLERQPDDPADLYGQTEAQLQARRRAHADALSAEEATLLKAQHDLKSAIEIREKLQKTLPIHKDQAEAWSRLANEGYAGRLLALERQRTYMETDQDLRAQSQNVASLSALVAQSEKRIAQIGSNHRQQLQNERIETGAIYHKLQQDWDKQQHRHSLLELKAPQAGIVKDLATHTPGTVVAPGTILLTLVPHEEPLVAEVWVGNADAGFVRPDQKARVKIAAYPFQKYGLLDGTVKQVSADAQARSDAGNAAIRSVQESAYRALIGLAGNHVENQGRPLRLMPGMQVSAEIHLGTRTVLEYLLSPVQKIAHDAGRER
ncbi:MAG TPA: HlyD family type I secretion periplasmic adaptor subunit [Burkholderiales bacterium]|jgi:HlyD family secretion protein